MKKFPNPRKIPKAERKARLLRWRVAHDRSTPRTLARENHLRSLIGQASP